MHCNSNIQESLWELFTQNENSVASMLSFSLIFTQNYMASEDLNIYSKSFMDCLYGTFAFIISNIL